jgi:hypothetical protein
MQQVRFKSSDYFASEHERSNSPSAMLTKEEAIAVGMNTATRVGGTRKPKVSGAATECVSYKLDADGNKVNARIFRAPTERKHNRRSLSDVERVEIENKILDMQHVPASSLTVLFAD